MSDFLSQEEREMMMMTGAVNHDGGERAGPENLWANVPHPLISRVIFFSSDGRRYLHSDKHDWRTFLRVHRLR